MITILIHRVVHSVINLIQQTQGTNLPSVPQATKLTLAQPFRTVNYTIQQTQMRLHTWAQYSKLDKTYVLKQLLITHGQANNLPARRTIPRLLAAFDPTSRK